MEKITYRTLILIIIVVALGCLGIWSQAGAAENATIKWTAPTENTDGSQLTDLSHYIVSYGLDPVNYTDTSTTVNDTTLIRGLINGETYYFSVQAVDTSGNISDYATPISTTIPDIDIISPGVPAELSIIINIDIRNN